jgi:hypothetical protein
MRALCIGGAETCCSRCVHGVVAGSRLVQFMNMRIRVARNTARLVRKGWLHQCSPPGIESTAPLECRYGRNRFAEEIFFDCITGKFTMVDVDDSDLDPNYCAMDVRLFHMQQVGAAT